MELLIILLIALLYLFSGLACCYVGFMAGRAIGQEKRPKQATVIDEKARREAEVQAQKEKRYYENFMSYDGNKQQDITE